MFQHVSVTVLYSLLAHCGITHYDFVFIVVWTDLMLNFIESCILLFFIDSCLWDSYKLKFNFAKPQFMALQYQSLARTSILFSPYMEIFVIVEYLGKLHHWHASSFMKFRCWYATHIQSHSLLIFNPGIWKWAWKYYERYFNIENKIGHCGKRHVIGHCKWAYNMPL